MIYILILLVLVELYYWLYWLPRNAHQTREFKIEQQCKALEDKWTMEK